MTPNSQPKYPSTFAKRFLLGISCVMIVSIMSILLFFANNINNHRNINHITPNTSVEGVIENKKVGEIRLYPDPIKTPGDILPNVTEKQICVSGYSTTVRNVPESQKNRIYQSYNVSFPVPKGSYEVDHFISLQLGGSNDDKNLWPEPAEPRPGFHEKDITENYLKKLVCDSKISLGQAQDRIRTDWYREYINWQKSKDNITNTNDDDI